MIQKNWQELIKPNKLEVTPGDDPKRQATAVAEPLERGFGVTLGNALRRVLLSSLQGAAVTSVHIDGVLHEFSSIPGVREDVTDIVLNIKDIAIKMQAEGPKRMTLQEAGTRPGHRRRHPDDLATSRSSTRTWCSARSTRAPRSAWSSRSTPARAMSPADRNRAEDAPIGLIPVDSLYSPVKKVAFKVENTREGQILDYDKLTLTLETNGAITPEDARRLRGAHHPGPARGLRQFRGAEEGSRGPVHRRSSPSIRRCSRRSTSSSCRSARRTA